MIRNLVILAAAAAVVALPLVFRRESEVADWRPGDPTVVVITPMNEAIRYEFGRAFSAWHRARHGRPARVDWRAIGGTSEIMRYLVSEYVQAARAWWTGQGKPWPAGAADALGARSFDTAQPPALARREGERDDEFAARERAHTERWAACRDLRLAFRATDDASRFTSRIDLLFGGGEYDHATAFQQGLTVVPWPHSSFPSNLFTAADGSALIPESVSGETWRTPTMFGAAASTFGICYNLDRLAELRVEDPPAQWDDLADPRLFRQVGAADPTKSGSIAKAFEMIVQQKCQDAVRAAGFSRADTDRFEREIAGAGGDIPSSVPAPYQAAVEKGWEDGLRLVQRIGANARYFTDSSSKIPVDVSVGDAAAGLAIDFYGRYQAQCSAGPDGRERMVYLTPIGGSSVSADPIGLLRGAENRETAIRFIEFLLSEEGQRLWTYRPGTPGGPERFALRRLPVRRDFYPGCDDERCREHARYAADRLADPTVNPFSLATNFVYRSRWTGRHFSLQRDLIRAMCLDSATELQDAWAAILRNGGPAAQPGAMALLGRLPDRPEPLTWASAPGIAKKYDRLDCLREWTAYFRRSYAEAKRSVR